MLRWRNDDDLTLHVLHHHAEVSPGLKRAEHGDDKRVLGEREDVSLHEGLLDLVPQDQVLLVDLLHGETLPGLLVTHQKHGATQEDGFQSEHASIQSAETWIQHSCCVVVSCSSFVFLSEYQRCKSKSLSPVGSVADELDVLKVFLSGCFGFSLRWSCWDGRYLTLKHTESTFKINTEMETIISVCTEYHFMCCRWTVLIWWLCTHIHWVVSLWCFWVPAVIAAQLGHFYRDTRVSQNRRRGGKKTGQSQ